MDPTILRYLSAIWRENDVREARCFDARGYITFGYFDTAEKMTVAISPILSTHEIYTTLQPVNPALLARAVNRLKRFQKGKDAATTDFDVENVDYVLVDIDPERPTKISASEKELKIARDLANKVIEDLGPPAVEALSGNGYHLIYRVKLLVSHDQFVTHREYLKACSENVREWLKAIDTKHSNGAVHIDVSVHNPARITKIIGTWARKGDSTNERPHRLSRIIQIPDTQTIITIPKIEKNEKQVKQISNRSNGGSERPVYSQAFDVYQYLTSHGIAVKETKPWKGGQMHILEQCVFDSTHNRGETSIIQHASGVITYQCHHNSCQNHTWADLRDSIGDPKKEFGRPCRECGVELTWEYGDKRPRDKATGDYHKCPKREITQKEGHWLRYNKKGIPYIITGLCALAFWEKQAGNLLYAQESFWQYSAGYWQKLSSDGVVKAKIQKMIEAADPTATKSSCVTDVFGQVLNKAIYATGGGANFAFDSNKALICLQNGVLDTETMKMRAHCREFYQSIQLPFSYLPEAKAPEWERYMKELEFQQDTNDRLQEWFGYCLVPDIRIEKCLFLHGDGGNGKSVYLETVTKVLEGNCSAVEPQETTERFQLIRIRGKLVNCCADISTQKVFSEKFKNIVSGELVESDVKHKSPIAFRPFARHLFSANKLIATKDRSYGFFRRFDILSFHKKFDDATKDIGLKARIWKNELPGVFNWALEGLIRLRRNKFRMTPSAEFAAAHDTFKRESNPVQMFIEECCTPIDLAYLEQTGLTGDLWQSYTVDNSVSCRQFREAYVVYCQEGGYRALSDIKLGKDVKRLGFERKRRSVVGQRCYYFSGIKLQS